MENSQRDTPNGPQYAKMVATGISGLDDVLLGGLPQRHLYLVEGESGTGKSTLGMQFLLHGARNGQRALLITLAEVAADLREIAASHGWSLKGLDIFELPPLQQAQIDEQQTVFPTAEVELSETTDQIVDVLRRKQPQRIVFDSLSELRFLAGGPVRFRYQMLVLSQVLAEIQATAIFIDRVTAQGPERVLDSLVHGIIQLHQSPRDYGGVWRRLIVRKLRGARYQGGWHDFRINTGGLEVYPRLRIGPEVEHEMWQQLSAGVEGIDTLLGGGLEFGTACLIGGGSGTGKSSVASLFVHSAVQQGIPAAMLLFDERPETLYKRSADLNVPLRPFRDAGLLSVTQIEGGEFSAGRFAAKIRRMVEEEGIRLLVIDSLSGYLRTMPEDSELLNQMHDLLNYLSRQQVLSIVVVTHRGGVGGIAERAVDLSYLADTVMFLRHFEARGALHHAISVVKKRHGQHEKTIRELRLAPGGLVVGDPLSAFRGVLTGNPEFIGNNERLLDLDEWSGDR